MIKQAIKAVLGVGKKEEGKFEIKPLIQNGDFDLLQMFCELLKTPTLMKVYKKIHLRWSNEDYSGESFFQAFAILYPFTQEELEQALAQKNISLNRFMTGSDW